MRTDIVQKVYDLILDDPGALDMRLWGFHYTRVQFSKCGTVACVAGHAALLAGNAWIKPETGELIKEEGYETWYHTGMDSLGIGQELATWLFDDACQHNDALNALRILLETGDEVEALDYLTYKAVDAPSGVDDDEEPWWWQSRFSEW